jgi:hypothetical protein
LAGLCLTGFEVSPASASPIHRHRIVVSSAQSLGPAWARFLEGGPSLWAVRKSPRFPSGLVLPTSNGKLVDTLFVDYLTWRRLLDPARFDHFHPNLAVSLTAPRTTPVRSTSVMARHPFNPAPQNLPEPSAFLLMFALFGVAFLFRARIEALGHAAPLRSDLIH